MKGVFCIDKTGFLSPGNIYCHYYLFITCAGIHTYTMASGSDEKKNTKKGM